MVLAWLVACGGGPESAVRAASAALEAGDREAFGEAVDVDVVIPEIGAACTELLLVADLSEQELGLAPDPLAGLVGMLTRAVVGAPELGESHLRTFEREFPKLPTDRCPALVLDLDHLETSRVDRDHATVSWPVAGDRGRWLVDVERREGEWHVAHAHGEEVVAGWRRAELEEAAVAARGLIDGLADGAPHDDWTRSRTWLRRHPEATAEAERWERAAASFVAAPPALPVEDVSFFQPRGWFRNRHVGATVVNVGSDEILSATVRFALVDEVGEEISAGALDALVVESGPLGPHGRAHVASPAARATWPDAARPEATVVVVTWADGRSWRHPAVEAGVWSALPTDVP